MITEGFLSISPKIFGKDWDRIKEGKEVNGETYLTPRLPLGYWTENTNMETKLVLSFGPETQSIALSQAELPYGTRFLFTCGCCGNTCNNLYLHNNVWKCGRCADIKYESSRINRHSSMGEILYRALWTNKAISIYDALKGHKMYKNKPIPKFISYINAAQKAGLYSKAQAAKMLINVAKELTDGQSQFI